MSLVKQLVEEIEENRKPKWKLSSEEYPDSTKIDRIYVWHNYRKRVELITVETIYDNSYWIDAFGRSYVKQDFASEMPYWTEYTEIEPPEKWGKKENKN